jgi:hypothetical protein
MKQISLFVSAARAQKGKVTKREQFLSEMDQVIPWARLVKVIEPHYPKPSNGRAPMGLQKMLRVYTGRIRSPMRARFVCFGTCWRSIACPIASSLKSRHC